MLWKGWTGQEKEDFGCSHTSRVVSSGKCLFYWNLVSLIFVLWTVFTIIIGLRTLPDFITMKSVTNNTLNMKSLSYSSGRPWKTVHKRRRRFIGSLFLSQQNRSHKEDRGLFSSRSTRRKKQKKKKKLPYSTTFATIRRDGSTGTSYCK